MTDGSVVLAVIRLLVSLAVVLVLLVALARWASKRGIGSGRPGRSSVEVEVLTRRSLGRNSTLQVVKVGSQVMVLGVTERGVSVLGELGEEDLVPSTAPLSVVPSIAPSIASSVLPPIAPQDAPAPAVAPAASVAAPLPRSTTWAEAEGRALVEAGLATRSSARAARAAAAGRPGRPQRRSRTVVPTSDSRTARKAAAAPTGWPWNAAAVVLGATSRSRRG